MSTLIIGIACMGFGWFIGRYERGDRYYSKDLKVGDRVKVIRNVDFLEKYTGEIGEVAFVLSSGNYRLNFNSIDYSLEFPYNSVRKVK